MKNLLNLLEMFTLNDERFQIKSKINKHYGSHIVEEKQYEDYS